MNANDAWVGKVVSGDLQFHPQKFGKAKNVTNNIDQVCSELYVTIFIFAVAQKVKKL
jgi:hypothetical protein